MTFYEYAVGRELDDSQAEPLIWMIQWDWEVFSESLAESERHVELLRAISESGWDDDSGEYPWDPHALYHRHIGRWFHSTYADYWYEFIDEVRRHPETPLASLPALFDEDLAQLEIALSPDSDLYRARVGFSGTNEQPHPYERACIGPPPPNKTGAGRANRKEQPVVYCAEEEDTAIYEVRPSRGNYVSVGRLKVVDQLRIVDLCEELPEPNPFTDKTLIYSVELRGLFLGLGDALAAPMRRTDDTSHYLPTQALAERIQATGFHGICYPSAMRKGGHNIVIFDPTRVTVEPGSQLVEIRDIDISYGAPDLDGY